MMCIVGIISIRTSMDSACVVHHLYTRVLLHFSFWLHMVMYQKLGSFFDLFKFSCTWVFAIPNNYNYEH
jgi:hypothetical protein